MFGSECWPIFDPDAEEEPPSPNLLRADHIALEVLLRPRIITHSCDSSLRTPRAVLLLTCLLVVSFVSLCMMATGRWIARVSKDFFFFSSLSLRDIDQIWGAHLFLAGQPTLFGRIAAIDISLTHPIYGWHGQIHLFSMNMDSGGGSSSLFARGCLINICDLCLT